MGMTFRDIPASPEVKAKEKYWNYTILDFGHFNTKLYKDNRA